MLPLPSQSIARSEVMPLTRQVPVTLSEVTLLTSLSFLLHEKSVKAKRRSKRFRIIVFLPQKQVLRQGLKNSVKTSSGLGRNADIDLAAFAHGTFNGEAAIEIFGAGLHIGDANARTFGF
ncbi:MAG: hypothetical protein JWP88_1184 [Flaviaesturariibacter sp.]|nr:hypothetical protein [Flaviaesturariibacter sp.]